MSDETNQNSETAPDGAEVMTRAEAQKLIGQRQSLKAEGAEMREALAAKDQSIASLEAKLADLAPKAKPDGKANGKTNGAKPAEMPAWATEFMTQVSGELTGVKDLFSQHRAGTAKSAVLSAVLKEVPDGQHKTAEALLGTLGVDFTLPGAAADALAILRTDHPAVLVDHSRGSQPRAPQLLPDGNPNFDAFKSFDEVPEEWMPAAIADQKTFDRLSANTEAGSAEHCI